MRFLPTALLLLPLAAHAAEPIPPDVAVAAAAEPASDGPAVPTPPDVLHGERYDGRAAEPPPRDLGRDVARALLWPPRMLVRGIGGVARPAMEWNEREHVQQRVTQALTSDDGLIGVRPVINYEADFTPSFGLLVFDNRMPDHMRSSVSSAFGGPSVLANDARLTIPLGEHVELALHADYWRRNDELYTGMGMHSPLPFSRYGFERVDATAALQYRPLHELRLEVGGDLGWRRFSNGTTYDGDQPIASVYCERGVGGRCDGPVDERLVPGYAAGTQFVRVHGAAQVDGRADELSAGLVADARVDYTHGLGSDESSYLRLHGHIGRSFEIWRRRTIYVGVSADDEVAFGKTPIPFSELVQLGGIDDLRGFRRARFRDASSLLGTIEYRWPIWMWMDGSLFVDYGGVFKPQFANFAVKDLRPDVGIGLRMHSTDKYSLRIQLAYGFGGGGGGGIRLVFAGNGESVVTALARTTALLLALSASLTHAQETATTEAPSLAPAQDESRVEERLRFIHERLKAEAVQARTWEAGWSIVYIGGLGYASYELAHAHSAAALTQGAIGAAQSLIGAMTMGLIPLKASRGAHELESARDADDSPERLRLAESLLRRNAAETELRYSWKPHVIQIVMNLIAGSAIWIAGDLRRGAQSAATAIAVGELQIWTQPWQARRDLREYRQRFGGFADTSTVARPVAASPALRISPTQLALTF